MCTNPIKDWPLWATPLSIFLVGLIPAVIFLMCKRYCPQGQEEEEEEEQEQEEQEEQQEHHLIPNAIPLGIMH